MENVVTEYEVTGRKKLHYVYVCSLYPYVLKMSSFPISHPEIYVESECSALIGTIPYFDFTSVEGLVQCKVLASRNLYHPVLPFRVRGKLLFALCRSYCETFSRAACTHDDSANREFEGTWMSCELKKAIEKDYRMETVSEIWNYRFEQYDPVTRQGGLFADYINCFLRLKQEDGLKASGWPSEYADDKNAKERYLRKYKEREGMVLDRRNTKIYKCLHIDRGGKFFCI